MHQETMTRYERLDKAWNIEEADRVPVSPVNCYIIPYVAGISIREMMSAAERAGTAYTARHFQAVR